jgi:hypothetical protein
MVEQVLVEIVPVFSMSIGKKTDSVVEQGCRIDKAVITRAKPADENLDRDDRG